MNNNDVSDRVWAKEQRRAKKRREAKRRAKRRRQYRMALYVHAFQLREVFDNAGMLFPGEVVRTKKGKCVVTLKGKLRRIK